MDIREAKTRKHALEAAILAQIQEYERETGATVEDVRVDSVDCSTWGDPRMRGAVAVRVGVRL